ncbi:MAG: hypothetical protein JXB04_09195 [Kiritimatiellae bacterium]|nr:hypothetical protein [Kiritimatiellia bacterium]
MTARDWKLSSSVFLCLALSLLFSACDKSSAPMPPSAVCLPGGITAVVFSQRDRQNEQFVNTVRDPLGVRRIIRGISIGKETDRPKHVFARRVVFLRGREEYVRISFDGDPVRDKYYLRYGEKQYETSRATYELLASYFTAPHRT